MYYCRSCGYRSQGDFCANRKCNNFGRCKNIDSESWQDENNSTTLNNAPSFLSDPSQTKNSHDMRGSRQQKDLGNTNNNPWQRDSSGMDAKNWQKDSYNPSKTPFDMKKPADFGDMPDMRYSREMNQQRDLHDSRDMRNPRDGSQTNKCKMPNIPCNEELQIAFATVPFQRFGQIFPLNKGLVVGTVFPDFDMPYTKKRMLGVD